MLEVRPWSLGSAKKKFRARNSNESVYLESHRGRRAEPAGLCRLRKQVTEAKEGPWSLGEEREVCSLREGRGRKGMGVLQGESALGPSSSWFLSAFQRQSTLGEVSGEDLNRIFISFPGVFLSGSWSLLSSWS